MDRPLNLFSNFDVNWWRNSLKNLCKLGRIKELTGAASKPSFLSKISINSHSFDSKKVYFLYWCEAKLRSNKKDYEKTSSELFLNQIMRIAIFKNGAVSICSSVRNDWRVALHEAHSELLFSLSSLQELPVSLFRVKGASLLPVLPRAPGSARCLRSLRHSLRYFRPAPSSLFATFARGIAFAFSLNFVKKKLNFIEYFYIRCRFCSACDGCCWPTGRCEAEEAPWRQSRHFQAPILHFPLTPGPWSEILGLKKFWIDFINLQKN